MPDFEDDGAAAAATPTDCAKLFGVVILSINDINLIEYFLRICEAHAVLAFDVSAFLPVQLKLHL